MNIKGVTYVEFSDGLSRSQFRELDTRPTDPTEEHLAEARFTLIDALQAPQVDERKLADAYGAYEAAYEVYQAGASEPAPTAQHNAHLAAVCTSVSEVARSHGFIDAAQAFTERSQAYADTAATDEATRTDTSKKDLMQAKG